METTIVDGNYVGFISKQPKLEESDKINLKPVFTDKKIMHEDKLTV